MIIRVSDVPITQSNIQLVKSEENIKPNDDMDKVSAWLQRHQTEITPKIG